MAQNSTTALKQKARAKYLKSGIKIPYLLKLTSHKSVASEPMGVNFEPMLQPNKCAKTKDKSLTSFKTKSPSIIIGKLLIKLLPNALKNPILRRLKNLPCSPMREIPLCKISNNPAFLSP